MFKQSKMCPKCGKIAKGEVIHMVIPRGEEDKYLCTCPDKKKETWGQLIGLDKEEDDKV